MDFKLSNGVTDTLECSTILIYLETHLDDKKIDHRPQTSNIYRLINGTSGLVCLVSTVSGCCKKPSEKHALVVGTKQSKLGPMLSNLFVHNLRFKQSVCQTRLDWKSLSGTSSLFHKFVNYRQKSFITLGPGREGSQGWLIFSGLCFVPAPSTLVLLKWVFHKLICVKQSTFHRNL